ncbi:helix-turn-helix domain-containing protein [Halodurantibacterium flavum]|uniref:Helix-turn-helix domain-containing protein n=1 Tax=Halodurantibacterium flavum TaxID=1382802 RepID=A0ABW4SAR6_9RHOB
MSRLPRPPAHVEPYVRILGHETAVAFLMYFGGGELYLPRKSGGKSPVEPVLGKEAASALAQAADRLPKRVPTAKPWLAEVMRAEGLSATEIARRLHVTDVAVRRWLKAADRRSGPSGARDPRQLPLI